MANNLKKSVILKTSLKTDVRHSGRKVSITGLAPIDEKFILDIRKISYRAEVPQVVSIGVTTLPVPTSDTTYTILIGDPTRTRETAQEVLKPYTYTTPADVTTLGTAAQQREAIYTGLIAKINADTNWNKVTAATLTGGTGMTITDAAGYNPARVNGGPNRNGASLVKFRAMDNGYGFTTANTSLTITTEAVIGSGVGARMVQDVVVIDPMNGNAISGTFEAPLDANGVGAVSGQKYDLFCITHYVEVAAHQVSGQSALKIEEQYLWVDNGAGSSTANLSGFLLFEKEMYRLAYSVLYKNNHEAIGEFFDSPGIFQGASGAVPTTTGQNKIASDYGQLVYNMIGTGTVCAPVPGNDGWNIDNDQTATEGSEYTPSLLTTSSKEFVVGKDEICIIGKCLVADHTDATVLFGLRKKEAHQADYNDYNDGAWIGFVGDLIKTAGILAAAATVLTNTTIVPTDAAWDSFRITVDINGLVAVYYNGTKYSVYSAGTTPMSFAAGTILVADIIAVNIGGGDPDVVVGTWLALPNKDFVS